MVGSKDGLTVSVKVAWLTIYSATRVPSHKAEVRQAVDPGVEGVGAVYILEYLRTWVILKASSIGSPSWLSVLWLSHSQA